MNMTPEEKAIELVNNYMSLLFSKPIFGLTTNEAKQCALIAVDEILNHHHQEQGLYVIDKYFWLQVKKEIENL
jgi:hypothetical protein